MRRAAQSFRAGEVNAMTQLFDALRRGADARVLLRSPALASVEAKFKRMVPRTEPTRAERARRTSDG
jgi:hypothetical protein